MKKLLLTLGLITALSIGTQGAFAGDCGCPEPDCGCPKKSDCGCKPKDECARPTCETCGEKAQMCFADCFDQKTEEIFCRLNLDDTQRCEADKIKDKFRPEIDCITDRIKEHHNCLCEALNADCLDKKAVRDHEKSLKTDIKDMKKQLKCADKEFKALLSCDQPKEYRKIKRELNYKYKKSVKHCCTCGDD